MAARPEEVRNGVPPREETDDSTDTLDDSSESNQVFDPNATLETLLEQSTGPLQTYPDVNFTFNKRSFCGTGVIEASRNTRFVNVANEINTQAPAAIRTFEGWSLHESLHDVEKYLAYKIKVGGDHIPRGAVANSGTVTDLLIVRMRAENDPVIQALDQVYAEYREDVGKADMAQLIRDIIYATKQALIIEVTDGYIFKFKTLVRQMIQDPSPTDER